MPPKTDGEEESTAVEPMWVLQDFSWSPFDMVAKRIPPEERDSTPKDSAAHRGSGKHTESTAAIGDNPSSSGSKTAEEHKSTQAEEIAGEDLGNTTQPPNTQPTLTDIKPQYDGQATLSGYAANRSTRLICQVHGCDANLAGLKEYHQRYKICAHHLKVWCGALLVLLSHMELTHMPDVYTQVHSIIEDGRQQRFCQQCGRFHDLAEFDGDKRSCRARLQKHNARRKKHADDSPKERKQRRTSNDSTLSPHMQPSSGGLPASVPLVLPSPVNFDHALVELLKVCCPVVDLLLF